MIQFFRVMSYSELEAHRGITQPGDVVLGFLSAGEAEIEIENKNSLYLRGEVPMEERLDKMFEFLHDKHAAGYKYIINVIYTDISNYGGGLLSFVEKYYGDMGIKIFIMGEHPSPNEDMLETMDKLYSRYVLDSLI